MPYSFHQPVYSRVSAQYEWIQSNVCAFSKSPPDWFDCASAAPVPTPTPTPTSSPIPEGKHNLLVVVTLDANPMETGWRLSTLGEGDDADEAIIFDMPVGSYADSDAGAIFQYNVQVDNEQFYNMTIFDSIGNGFGGTVLVSDLTTPEMSVLMYEPGFTDVSGTIVSHGFYVGSSPPQYLTLNLVFDVFPNELAFDISNDDDDIIFALAWFGTFDTSYKSATAFIPIYGPSIDDRGYTLRIWDSNNDGICCQWGDGRYDLYLGDPDSGGTLLVGGSGNYGTAGTFPFVIMGDSSLALPLTTSLPSSLVPMRPSTKPSLRPPVLVTTTSGSAATPAEGIAIDHNAGNEFGTMSKPLNSSSTLPLKDDAAVPKKEVEDHAMNDGTNTGSDKTTVVSAEAYDASSSTDRKVYARVILMVVASSLWLVY